jgi:hypothetical protein
LLINPNSNATRGTVVGGRSGVGFRAAGPTLATVMAIRMAS